jgi:hypothetical protein
VVYTSADRICAFHVREGELIPPLQQDPAGPGKKPRGRGKGKVDQYTIGKWKWKVFHGGQRKRMMGLKRHQYRRVAREVAQEFHARSAVLDRELEEKAREAIASIRALGDSQLRSGVTDTALKAARAKRTFMNAHEKLAGPEMAKKMWNAKLIGVQRWQMRKEKDKLMHTELARLDDDASVLAVVRRIPQLWDLQERLTVVSRSPVVLRWSGRPKTQREPEFDDSIYEKVREDPEELRTYSKDFDADHVQIAEDKTRALPTSRLKNKWCLKIGRCVCGVNIWLAWCHAEFDRVQGCTFVIYCSHSGSFGWGWGVMPCVAFRFRSL